MNDIDQQLIELALIEDLGKPFSDLTTTTLFADELETFKARIISKNSESIVICGIPIVSAILGKLPGQCEIYSHFQDGELLQSGETLLEITGPANTLLIAERTILNFLQHLCGIATLTAKFVTAVKETGAKILDTRKTLPGFRHLEKYAVYCGGGVNHRMGLYDAMMIKDTHIDLIGGMAQTLKRLPEKIMQQYPVIVEVRTIQELEVVLTQGRKKVTRVLLDNMPPLEMKQCVKLCNEIFPTEASGNINLDNILPIAHCGVDFISIGKLTHSAKSVDLSMKCGFK